jgi:DNA-binding CsgD family transcriptional regulator
VLTRRQRQVVAAYATGLMRKEVAHQLGIAKNTVDVHLTAIYDLTGFANRTELTRWWLGLDDDGLCPVTLGRCSLPAGHHGAHQAAFG